MSTGDDRDGGVGGLIEAVRDTERVLEDIAAKQRTSRAVQWVLGAVVVGLFVASVVLAGVVVQQYRAANATERQRCLDAIEARADLRSAIPGVVTAMFAPEVPDEPERLSTLVERGRAFLEAEYGPPPCAEREGLEDPVATATSSPPASPLPAPTAGTLPPTTVP